MGATELDGISKAVQIGQGITVTALLLIIVWAFYSNKVKTKEAYVEDVTILKQVHERELASVQAEMGRERARGDKWEALSLDLLEKATISVQTATEAVGELTSQRRSPRR